MSYTFLRDAVAESSVESFSDMNLSALWKSSRMREKSYSQDSVTEASRNSQSGMTCELSTGDRGEESPMSSAAASRVRTLAQSEKERDSMVSEADCGEKCGAWFAKFNRDSCSWKTPQCSLFEDWGEFSVTWPRWGMMRRGVCYPLAPLVRHTHESACGFWPTPRKANTWEYKTKPSGGGGCRNLGWQLGGLPNPTWEEWLMGWPMTWTELRPLATDKFRQWFSKHGKH